MTDFQSFANVYERYRQNLAKANDHNKTVLFDALAAAAITSVTVSFDGEGESGQIQDVSAFVGDKPLKLPQTSITVQHAQWGADELRLCDQPLSDAIETLCYAYLELEHRGWENNDGAYGEFTFTVADRRIVLDFNARYTDIHNSIYSF
jgi:Family of unknown function (DUF6878)